MTNADVSPDALRSWLQTIDDALASVNSRMQPLLAEQAALTERRTLVQGLLASVTGGAQAVNYAPSAGESVRDRIHRQAVEVLQSVGRPLHINELQAEFVKRGFAIPGLGQAANITVHLSKWDDVSSPRRGYYALSAEANRGR